MTLGGTLEMPRGHQWTSRRIRNTEERVLRTLSWNLLSIHGF